MELIDAGLEELEVDEDNVTVYCNFTDFNNLQTKLEDLELKLKTQNYKEYQTVLKNHM